mgnify:CR=1 FL=1
MHRVRFEQRGQLDQSGQAVERKEAGLEDIFEAPNEEAAAKVSLITQSCGASRAESWTAIPYKQFSKLMKERRKTYEDVTTLVQQLLAEYGDRIRFVYRDFPLQSHQRATPAARAAVVSMTASPT